MDRFGPEWAEPLGHDRIGAPVCNGVAALARVTGPIRGNRAQLRISGDPVKELGQHGRAPDFASGDLDGSDLQRLFVDADVDLAPWTTFRSTRLAGEARLDRGIAILRLQTSLAGGRRHPDHVRIEPDRQRAKLLQRVRRRARTNGAFAGLL
ncbi:regulator [Rhodovulum sulfidophilum]|uniref:Regulator n=1 Tax=Rhodovulum sulfidophilum TaxID=35806 RepID=A0A0D6B1A5_RHOSU|nr:regulator [Rhodovulum sulfidophilum]